jgi:hypothetical protein
MARATGLEPAASGVTGRTSISRINGAGDFFAALTVAKTGNVARLIRDDTVVVRRARGWLPSAFWLDCRSHDAQ